MAPPTTSEQTLAETLRSQRITAYAESDSTTELNADSDTSISENGLPAVSSRRKMTRSKPIREQVKGLYEDNVTAKIFRTAANSLVNNVRLLFDLVNTTQ